MVFLSRPRVVFNYSATLGLRTPTAFKKKAQAQENAVFLDAIRNVVCLHNLSISISALLKVFLLEV